MVVVPLSKPESDSDVTPVAEKSEPMNWVGFAAGGTLVAAGLLLLVGERRAGMVAAASGTALALIDEKKTLRTWWNALPDYIDHVQRVLNQVQTTVEDVDAKREALHQILSR
jgi:hypothetical protein